MFLNGICQVGIELNIAWSVICSVHVLFFHSWSKDPTDPAFSVTEICNFVAARNGQLVRAFAGTLDGLRGNLGKETEF